MSGRDTGEVGGEGVSGRDTGKGSGEGVSGQDTGEGSGEGVSGRDTGEGSGEGVSGRDTGEDGGEGVLTILESLYSTIGCSSISFFSISSPSELSVSDNLESTSSNPTTSSLLLLIISASSKTSISSCTSSGEGCGDMISSEVCGGDSIGVGFRTTSGDLSAMTFGDISAVTSDLSTVSCAGGLKELRTRVMDIFSVLT